MKTTLFLTEQLIAILIFAVCLMICTGIFIKSYTMADGSKDLNNALFLAESAAEVYKSVHGDTDRVALLLGGGVSDGVVCVYYDEGLNICKKDTAIYVMSITTETLGKASALLSFGDVSVHKNEEELISFTVAARSE